MSAEFYVLGCLPGRRSGRCRPGTEVDRIRVWWSVAIVRVAVVGVAVLIVAVVGMIPSHAVIGPDSRKPEADIALPRKEATLKSSEFWVEEWAAIARADKAPAETTRSGTKTTAATLSDMRFM